MEIARIIEIVESAFAPLDVLAEEWDWGARVRYRVRLPEPHDAIRRDDLFVYTLTYDGLRTLIEQDRRLIQEKGISLPPWGMPVPPTQS